MNRRRLTPRKVWPKTSSLYEMPVSFKDGAKQGALPEVSSQNTIDLIVSKRNAAAYRRVTRFSPA